LKYIFIFNIYYITIALFFDFIIVIDYISNFFFVMY